MNQYSSVPALARQTSKQTSQPGPAPADPDLSGNDAPAFFRPADLIAMVKSRRRTIIGFALTAMFLTGLLLLNATPRYVASSKMLLGEQGLSAQNSFDLVEAQNLTSSVIEGELAVLRSNVLLHRVAEKLALENVVEFNPAADADAQPSLIDGLKSWVKSLLPVGTPEVDPLATDVPSEISLAASASATQLGDYKDIVGKLRRAVSVRQQGTSYVVQVSSASEDPELAAAIANTVMNEYLKFLTDKRFDAAQEFTQWLETRLADLAITLEASERAVVDYRARLEADADNRTRLDQQMTELTTRLVAQRSELAEVEAMYQKMKTTVENDGPLAAQNLSSSEEMLDYRSQLSDLNQREAFAAGSFGEGSAQVASIRRSIATLESSIEIEVRRELDRLSNQREVLNVVVGSMESSLSELSRQMLNQSSEEIQLSQLRRVADANRQVYQQFLGRFKEVSEIQNLQTPDAEIISYANPPAAPVYPRRKLSLILAGFGGVFLALAFILVTEMLPKKIATAQQLARATGVGVYGNVHNIGAGMTLYELARQLNIAPEGDLAKTANRLANNADMRAGGAARTILVGSDGDRTEKLQVTLMLAWAQARKGRSCVIVDADMREAQLSSRLEYRKPETNLSSVLYGDGVVADALTQLPRLGAAFLPTEEMGADPAVIFDTEKFHEITQSLLSNFDTVILALPAATSFTESYTALDEADVNLFVVRADSLTAGELNQPLSVAQSAKARNFGLVLAS